MKIVSYSAVSGSMRSRSQSMIASQELVPGNCVLASVEIAFDWSSSSGSPAMRLTFSGIEEL